MAFWWNAAVQRRITPNGYWEGYPCPADPTGTTWFWIADRTVRWLRPPNPGTFEVVAHRYIQELPIYHFLSTSGVRQQAQLSMFHGFATYRVWPNMWHRINAVLGTPDQVRMPRGRPSDIWELARRDRLRDVATILAAGTDNWDVTRDTPPPTTLVRRSGRNHEGPSSVDNIRVPPHRPFDAYF